jgi:hypothetical protein
VEQVKSATTLLRRLVQQRIAPKGEHVVDVERATPPGAAGPEPVLLLTDRALYAMGKAGSSWTRLPLAKVHTVSVSTDPTGMLTRYRVFDDEGTLWFDLALPMARSTFRERMEQVASRRSGTARPATFSSAALASLASTASFASLVSPASPRPVMVRTRRVA